MTAARRREAEKKTSKVVEALIEKYKEIAAMVEREGKQYAIKLDTESSEDVSIKYRLVLKPTARGIIHTLEILDATEERSAIQIPLAGRDWERILNHADRVFNAMTTEKFREVADLLIELSNRLNLGGRSSVTEVE
jgi:dTDP-D-glucose 4,6-dehydratase